eukprot:1513365-Pyramimonas_sp.AAC.1
MTSTPREYVGEWPSAVLIQGGHVNGNPAPPMTCLAHSSAERRGQLGEEERTQATSALMNFNRPLQESMENPLLPSSTSFATGRVRT